MHNKICNMTNALQCIWWYVRFLIFKHPRCYRAAPILLHTEACAGGTMVWGASVHPSLYTSTIVIGLESGVWGKNPLGRRSSGNLWDLEHTLSAAWWFTHQQCTRIYSLGGSSHGSLEAAWPCFYGTGPWQVGTKLESCYECYVRYHADVLCPRRCPLFLARVL